MESRVAVGGGRERDVPLTGQGCRSVGRRDPSTALELIFSRRAAPVLSTIQVRGTLRAG
jgi:hypothetical protein